MLRARVKVIGYTAGVRAEFMPGDEVTGLHPHDVRELLASKSIEDTDAIKKDEKSAQRVQNAAKREFELAKELVSAAHESTLPDSAAE